MIIDTEQVTVKRKDDGTLVSVSSGARIIEMLLEDFKNEELPDADAPYSHEAEIAAGLRRFAEWLREKAAE